MPNFPVLRLVTPTNVLCAMVVDLWWWVTADICCTSPLYESSTVLCLYLLNWTFHVYWRNLHQYSKLRVTWSQVDRPKNSSYAIIPVIRSKSRTFQPNGPEKIIRVQRYFEFELESTEASRAMPHSWRKIDRCSSLIPENRRRQSSRVF